jgi:hypothetical protein
VHLIPLALRLRPYLSRLIEELHTGQPLFRRKINLSCEVVEMPHRRAEDLLHARASVGSACINDMLGEVWVIVLRLCHVFAKCQLGVDTTVSEWKSGMVK